MRGEQKHARAEDSAKGATALRARATTAHGGRGADVVDDVALLSMPREKASGYLSAHQPKTSFACTSKRLCRKGAIGG